MKRFNNVLLLLLAIGILFSANAIAQKAQEDSLTKAIKHNMRMVQLAVEDYATKNGVYPTKVADFLPLIPNIKNPVDPKLPAVVDGSSGRPGQVAFKQGEKVYEVTGNDKNGKGLTTKLSGNIANNTNTVNTIGTRGKNAQQQALNEKIKEDEFFEKMAKDKSSKGKAKDYERYLISNNSYKRGIVIKRLGYMKDPEASSFLFSIINNKNEKKGTRRAAAISFMRNKERVLKSDYTAKIFNEQSLCLDYNIMSELLNNYIECIYSINNSEGKLLPNDTSSAYYRYNFGKSNKMGENVYNALVQYLEVKNGKIIAGKNKMVLARMICAADKIPANKRINTLWKTAEYIIDNGIDKNEVTTIDRYETNAWFLRYICISYIPRTNATKDLIALVPKYSEDKKDWLIIALTCSGNKSYKNELISIFNTTNDKNKKATALMALEVINDKSLIPFFYEQVERNINAEDTLGKEIRQYSIDALRKLGEILTIRDGKLIKGYKK